MTDNAKTAFTEGDLAALQNRVRAILDDMPKADSYGKLQALMGIVMAVSGSGPAACAAFARAASVVLAHADERVHVHVLSEGKTVVFEGDTATVRTLGLDDDGEMVEVEPPTRIH